jgi:nitrous oxide reductase accessory protein NosL
MTELQWRAWCWYEGLGKLEYQGPAGTALWRHYYTSFKFSFTRDMYAEAMALSA